MPYRSYERRVRNYEIAVIPEVVSTKFTQRKDAMVDGQEQMQEAITAMETSVRSILDDEGIAGVARVPYLNFARTLFRAKGHQSGTALQKVAAAEKAKFVSLGLDPDILDKIANVVIGAAPAY